jgi:hypothetical protein
LFTVGVLRGWVGILRNDAMGWVMIDKALSGGSSRHQANPATSVCTTGTREGTLHPPTAGTTSVCFQISSSSASMSSSSSRPGGTAEVKPLM